MNLFAVYRRDSGGSGARNVSPRDTVIPEGDASTA